MNLLARLSLVLLAAGHAVAAELDLEAFGESLGGWRKDGQTVDYELSGAKYRTFRPEITPTPDGGMFVSVRIDHLRGWLSNNDHAVLEVSFGPDGSVVSAQSNLAIQGRTISSDLIRSSANAGAAVTGVEGAVRIGTDLVADLSSKLLREKIVEAGRVTYPAALRHNYNLLFQAIRAETEPAAHGDSATVTTTEPAAPAAKPLDVQPYGTPTGGRLQD